MKTTKKETSPGTESLEEETYDLLDKLSPKKKGRCRGNTKAVGRACVEGWTPQAVTLDNRIGVTFSHAAYYLRMLPRRVDEIKQAGDEVLLADRKTEGSTK